MAELITGDDSAITLVASPNEALQPRAIKDELPGLDLSVPKIPLISGQNIFSIIKDENPPGQSGVIEQQFYKVLPIIEPPPHRQDTLDGALAQQVGLPVPYHTVSETIVQMIYDSLGRGYEEPCLLLKDSKTVVKIAQIIEDFVSTNFLNGSNRRRLDFDNFVTQPESQCKIRTTMDFYIEILPFDLVKKAKERRKCMGFKPKKVLCGQRKKLDDLKLDILIEELSGMPKPRDISEVMKVLFRIVHMTFCHWHLDTKLHEIYELQEYFFKNKTSSIRSLELRCLDQWLRTLGHVDNPSRKDVGAKEADNKSSKGVSLLKNLCLSTDSADTPNSLPMLRNNGQTTNVMIPRDLFVFKDKFKMPGFAFVPNSTHKTLRLYEWPSKKAGLTPQELVDQTMKKQLTPADSLNKGHIYVYRHREDFGMVKIGFSSGTAEQRLESWRKQCKYMVDECKDRLCDANPDASHPLRLEALIHAELKEKRHEVLKCEVCGERHKEWFKVSANEAQEVVKKWTSWMQSEPYDKEGYLRPGARDRPVVGDCEDRRSKSSLRASAMARSTHPMVLRPRVPSDKFVDWSSIVPVPPSKWTVREADLPSPKT